MAEQQKKQCHYLEEAGLRCTHSIDGNSLYCFWHHAEAEKSSAAIKSSLEQLVKQGQSLEGFRLKHAHLEEVNLSASGQPVNLQNANLYRAHLEGAHLFSADLRGAILMKANLSRANLNCTKMQNANLLGCMLHGAKIERVEWGDQILHEQQANRAKRAGRHFEAHRFFVEAEEIYRNLRQAYEQRGLIEDAGRFFQKEMKMKRYQMPLWSKARLFSKLVDVFSGYGEKPSRVINFSLTCIVLCAILYFIFGVNGPEGYIGFDQSLSFYENTMNFFKTLYFSIVTFTTLGYGDITPLGGMRAVAAIEAFTGSFTIALFVVVFVKKMTR